MPTGDSPSNIPQSLTQLLDKAAKEDPSPKNLRNDIHNATTQIDKLPMQLAVDLSILETPEYVRLEAPVTVHKETAVLLSHDCSRPTILPFGIAAYCNQRFQVSAGAGTAPPRSGQPTA